MKNILKQTLSLGICSALLICALSGCGAQSGDSNLTVEPFQGNPGDIQTMEMPDSGEGPQPSDEPVTSGGGSQPGDETINSGKVICPSEAPSGDTDLSLAYTDFAVCLLQESLESEKNTLISPLSVVNALAMTANGAKGETLAQMENLLGADISSLSEYLHNYNASLPSGEKYSLHAANSVWLKNREDFTVEESFLQSNTDLFGAEIYRAAFDSSTLKDINHWVARNTDNMIPEILNEINPNSVMYLINALAFDAEWQSPYMNSQVRDAVFHLEIGTEKDIKLMHSKENILLQDITDRDEAAATGFLKYYADGKYAFAVLLPDESTSVEDYVSSLTGERLRQILTGASEANIRAALPKFEAEYGIDMSDVLKSLGMTDAFDPDIADFSGIVSCPDENIYISRVIHKTYIAVDEQGTKAAAATAVEIRAESASVITPEEIIYITLDRPFVYMIIDCEENLPVFIGTVMEP